MKPAAATEAASLLQYDDSGLCYSDDVTHKEHVRNIGQLMSGTATALSTGGMAHTEPALKEEHHALPVSEARSLVGLLAFSAVKHPGEVPRHACLA